MSDRAAASHVLLVAPVDLRYNPETADSNAFMRAPDADEARALTQAAEVQHRTLRDLLIENGVTITVARSTAATPDAPFCNNWFSTHAGRADERTAGSAEGETGGILVLYPLLAKSRRLERRPDLVSLLSTGHARVVDFTVREDAGTFLESTGSLCLDRDAGIAYAALSPRTDRALAREWADRLGYRLVTFTATDAASVPYYHTNVMMFIGHGLAGVCLESIDDQAERESVAENLRTSGLEVMTITRQQVLCYCGNCLGLVNDEGEPLMVMSTAAYQGLTAEQRATIEGHARILHTDLGAFETLGGGSARCLLGELY